MGKVYKYSSADLLVRAFPKTVTKQIYALIILKADE